MGKHIYFSRGSLFCVNNSMTVDNIIYLLVILFVGTFWIDLPCNFLTIAFAIGVINYLWKGQKIHLKSYHLQFIGVFIGAIFLTVMLHYDSANFKQSLKAFKSVYVSPLVGIGVMCFCRFTKRRALILLTVGSAVLSTNALYVIYQYYMGMIKYCFRIIGYFSDIMLWAGAQTLLLPIIFAVLAFGYKKINTYLYLFFLFTFIVNIPAVILSGTRIMWISLLSFCVCSLIFMGWKKRLVFGLPSILLIVFISAFIFFNPFHNYTYAARLKSIDNIHLNTDGYNSNKERIYLWQASLNMFKDHPIIGVGVGNFYEAYRYKYAPTEVKKFYFHAHDVFLNILAQAGSIGFIGLLSLFIYLYYDAIKTWRKKREIMSIAYLLTLISYNVNFLTDVLFCGHYLKLPTYLFWLITGIYVSVTHKIELQAKLGHMIWK